jgi:hypothetical protein
MFRSVRASLCLIGLFAGILIPTQLARADSQRATRLASCTRASSASRAALGHYTPCIARSSQPVPLGRVNAYNWDYGPITYGEYYEGQLVGTTSNYARGQLSGHDALVYNAYSAWKSGIPVKQRINAWIYDETTGTYPAHGSDTAMTENKGVLFTPTNWLLTLMTVGHHYHFDFRFDVYATEFGWLIGPLVKSESFVCTSADCHFP